ncbi:MAG: hypothetical protein ACKOKF_06250, partial [Bacteroidota bacterium]
MNLHRLLSLSFFCIVYCSLAGAADSTDIRKVLVVPYQPGMHMSDADIDISMQSEKDIMQIRKVLRESVVGNLRSQIVSSRQVSILRTDHVAEDDNDERNVYRSIYFEKDTVWPVLHPVKDTNEIKKKPFSLKEKKTTSPKDITYMNVGFHDQQLLSELGRNYGAEVVVCLNELEINTSSKDCIDLANHIYDRTIRLHYSIFDFHSKQLYGDVAEIHITSATNDIDEIISKHIPLLTS